MTKKCKTLLSAGMFCILMILSTPVLATVKPDKDRETGNKIAENSASERREEAKGKRVENLKERVIKEIDRRISALNKIAVRADKMKKLSGQSKSALKTEIEVNISSLEAMKTKVQGDTDAEVLKADAKTIAESFKVYAFYMPKIHILTSADSTLLTLDKLSKIVDKLEAKITTAETAGKDATSLKTQLIEMKAKIESAKTKANTIITNVLALKLADYPGNKTALQNNRQSLKGVREDIIAAKQTGVKILTALKDFETEE